MWCLFGWFFVCFIFILLLVKKIQGQHINAMTKSVS